MSKLDFVKNEKIHQIDYRENLAIAMKAMEEISMDLSSDDEIRKELQRLDLMQEDILHMIEFHKFNASEGYNLSAMIKEVRLERRKIKNRMQERQRLQSFIQQYNRTIKTPVDSSLKMFETLKKQRVHTQYKLKAFHELEGFNNYKYKK